MRAGESRADSNGGRASWGRGVAAGGAGFDAYTGRKRAMTEQKTDYDMRGMGGYSTWQQKIRLERLSDGRIRKSATVVVVARRVRTGSGARVCCGDRGKDRS